MHNATPNKQITQNNMLPFLKFNLYKEIAKLAYKALWVKKSCSFLCMVRNFLPDLSYHTCIHSKTFRVKNHLRSRSESRINFDINHPSKWNDVIHEVVSRAIVIGSGHNGRQFIICWAVNGYPWMYPPPNNLQTKAFEIDEWDDTIQRELPFLHLEDGWENRAG